MSYNPTVYICSGDIANRALCNGTQYNPLKQKCKNNTQPNFITQKRKIADTVLCLQNKFSILSGL